MSENDTSELQIKISFLERHIEEQDRVILELRQDTDLIKKELFKLKDRMESDSSGSEGAPADERPPHY